ncbi:hypothetical protein DFA_09611 [Cavenderia fasciculata]|uniref:PiggyBac transposable element-derived protein domain-containing protein n=1 Tax=Cavenderia fasciculata TaxID=261658 RepID=F4Q840_CACFS|nr:uncharacterized protein DFA_09611 [Cavenderia fasciculata]EGG15940.1 hypothetical protein DFA_09611 [Cavenderia fasciculata]|eukprot:XP_004352265.1 hypothetical protein DFA_09611 [Cavenderia fasciculata]
MSAGRREQKDYDSTNLFIYTMPNKRKPIQQQVDGTDGQPIKHTKVPRGEEFIESMITKSIVKEIVLFSNRTDAFCQDKPKLNVFEVYNYFALVFTSITLGIDNNTELFTTGTWSYNYPFKGESLPKSRWELIHPNIYIPIDIFVNMLQANFKRHIDPGTFLTVDESRIKAKPRDKDLLSFNKDKPEKWAIEYNTLSDTKTRYLLAMIPSKEYNGETSFQKLVESVKLDTKKDYHITADSKFSTLNQISYLERNGMYGTLCIKADRLPSEVWKVGIIVGLPQWKSRFAFKGATIAAGYHRNKVMRLATNSFKMKSSKTRVTSEIDTNKSNNNRDKKIENENFVASQQVLSPLELESAIFLIQQYGVATVSQGQALCNTSYFTCGTVGGEYHVTNVLCQAD